MTSRQFREDMQLRESLALALHDGAVDLALTIAETEFNLTDAPVGSAEVVSVRLLSQGVGRCQVRKKLMELTQPWPQEEKELAMTFGTKHSVEEFDQP